MVCWVLSFLVYFERKSKVILGIDIYSFLLCLVGFVATMQVHLVRMMVHSFLLTSVIGAFFFYCLIEAIFYDEGDTFTSGLSESEVLLICSIPYL